MKTYLPLVSESKVKHFIPCLPLLLWFVIPFLPTIMAANEPTLAPAYRTAADVTMDRLESIVIVDGDTIRASIYLGRGVLLRNETIRLEGLDTYESKRIRRTVKISDEELKKGRLATDALAGLVRDAPVALLSDGGRDNYGRCLGRLSLVQRDGTVVDAAEWMIQHHHDRNHQ